jgi:menaquinone-specific isochorismate synthase
LLDDHALHMTDSALERIRVATTAAPVVGVDAVYRLWQHQDALLWDPRAGKRAVAAGAVMRLRAVGPRRIARLHEAGRRLWHSVDVEQAADAPAPRLWGGFSFAPGTAARDPWQQFGDASFVLPRLTYWTDGERAWLQAAGARSSDSLAGDLALANAAIAQAAIDHDASCNAEAEPYHAPRCEITRANVATWRRQVKGILAAIDAGRVRKVVAARCAKVTFERPPSVAGVLGNLRTETGPVWRFALTCNGTAFFGATPEILVRRRDEAIESEALAGTLAKSKGSGGDLLASRKDRIEHRFVCDGIVEALAPLCSTLHAAETPTVRELQWLFHLATPIHARLAGRTHVLELCERLHPTPATGGTPRAGALEMILSTETAPRGWYAAPLGWFDAEGDGEFVVALRSAVVCGNTAHVYAGAGIVAGSHADEELAEIELKQRALFSALGVAGT